MTFNPDRSKQAQEVIFSRKLKKATLPPLLFSNNNVLQVSSQKHLGVILDIKLTFEEHLKKVLIKANKTIGLLRKLSNSLPYFTRTPGNIPLNFFKNYFFPSAIIEWNNLDPSLRNSKSASIFKEKILNFIRPLQVFFLIITILKELNLLQD